ncbi:hypothetical protein HT136_08445 [Novosphingobium profundi]|uniref:hypothetical protein n=1 Tax=Novosphingobium profundi TaxID=1774954 RepID=UPI001BD986EB|nr:hypothetical protein [Novosphingobium profundi]MBT0668397.1 hypothetical protein [Novosphingobium profundi]
MSKFKLPTPISTDAVWTEIWKDGECYGQFKVKYQDISSPEFNLQFKRAADQLSKSERHRADNPKTPEEVLLKRNLYIGILASNYIVDSKIIGSDGETLPHNMATVLEMLLTPELYFVAQELDQFASTEDNFKAAVAAKEAKKN